MFVGANGIFCVSFRKTVFFFVFIVDIQWGKICGISSTKRCNCKMFVQVSITFSNMRLVIRVNRVLWNLSRSRFRSFFFLVLFFMNWFEYKQFRSTLDKDLHLILPLFFIVSIYVLNSWSSHLVFLGVHATFQVFLLKNYVFLLNSIERKDSRFISGFFLS